MFSRCLMPAVIGLSMQPLVAAASSLFPEIAYQARQVIVMPPAPENAIALRLEELIALPAPAPLGVPAMVAAEEAPKDVWDRIRKRFGMAQLTSPLVEQQQQAFLKRPEVLKSILQRSRRYLYHVVSEVERRNFPMELALLPMMESGYNPHALSSAQAHGIWQFIPSTGKKYALAQNDTYDARRDIIASTRAAMDYLQFLYGLVGDWHLALASYNWGEESVMAAMERNKARGRPPTYEALTLPDETRLYVPKLLALRNIIANPEAFGIELEPLPNEPYFVVVENSRHLDVKTAAKLAEMPVNEFIALNPGFSGAAMAPVHTSRILVPVEKAEIFRQNLENLKPARNRVSVPGSIIETRAPGVVRQN